MIYAISDLHLDKTKEKSMEVFGKAWERYEEKIFNNWTNIIKEDDIVLVPGDISWAMKLEGAYYDLKRIDDLPGKKILIKGNHDYWWQSLKKILGYNFKSTYFIQNRGFVFNDIGIAGTRGWICNGEDFNDERDKKVFKREMGRLNRSLMDVKNNVDKKIVMLHYPPFNLNSMPNDFVDIMVKHKVDICLYGHLHSEGHKYIVEGNIQGIDFHCVSSDYLDFKPKLII